MTSSTALKCSKCHQPATAARTDPNGTLSLCIGCAALESLTIPAELEKRSAAPDKYQQGAAGALIQQVDAQGRIWSHQALSLEILGSCANLVVSTATASGKTLIFQSHAMQVTTESDATALVLYPIKALGNDQAEKWREAAEAAGLPGNAIGRIDGDTQMQHRPAILDRAKVVAMTPDVCHAWLLRTQGQAAQARFLAKLKLVIIDEAHTYDSVFGSNAAYMFRRLISAAITETKKKDIQFIAATATILEPAQHMKNLTGQDFESVAQEMCGAPRQAREIHHVPADGGSHVLEQTTARLMNAIINADPSAQIITFHDSRQGVERIVQYAGRPDDIVPYRSGYLGSERKDIEDQLRRGAIKGVVSTSALEMGIDMPDLSYGLNVGLPTTRKQLHQRLGRIGRTSPGTFIIIAPSSQFEAYGDSMEDYIRESVEATNLYINNEHIGYHQARCLKQELETRGANAMIPPESCRWPDGFQQLIREAHSRTPRLNSIRPPASGPPQLSHTMRSTGEEELQLMALDQGQGKSQPEQRKVGTISLPYAMNEAYPGAIYRHYGKCYEVQEWARNRSSKEGRIKMQQIPSVRERTHSLERQLAVIDLDQTRNSQDLKEKERGFYQRTAMNIIQSVEGFVKTGDPPILYENLSRIDPGKSRKQRTYGTTGLHITIDSEWFQGNDSQGWANRVQLAKTLKSHLCYRRSIASGDIDFVADNIFLKSAKGCMLSENSLVVYDDVIGGLGLTNHLFENLREYADSLLRSATDEKTKLERIERKTARLFLEWLDETQQQAPTSQEEQTSWWRVLQPGTRIRYYSPRKKGLDEGSTEEPIWQEGIKYILRNKEGRIELEPLAEDALQPIRPPDWQLWMPAENRYERIRID